MYCHILNAFNCIPWIFLLFIFITSYRAQFHRKVAWGGVFRWTTLNSGNKRDIKQALPQFFYS